MTVISKTTRITKALQAIFALFALFAGLALLATAPASSATYGTEQVLRHLQDVSIRNASGDSLYLGYKVSFHWFVLPIGVSNDGYVLAAKDKQIFYTAEQAKLEQWQAEGYLPTPLPRGRLSLADYLFGNLLWIVLGTIGLWYARCEMKYRRAAAAAAKVLPFKPKQAVTSSPAPVVAATTEVKPGVETKAAPVPTERRPASAAAPAKSPEATSTVTAPAAPPAQPAAIKPEPITSEQIKPDPTKLTVAKTVCRVKQIKVA